MYNLGMIDASPQTLTTRFIEYHDDDLSIGKLRFAGTIRQSAGVRMDQMRVLGQYALVLITAGGGAYAQQNGMRTVVSAGDVLLIFPDVAHGYGPTADRNWDEIYLVFDGPVFDAWRGMMQAMGPVVSGAPLRQTFMKFRSVAMRSGAVRRLLELQSLLADLWEFSRLGRSSEPAWLSRAKEMLSLAPLDARGDPKRVASAVGVDYELFRKRFRQEMGTSPGKFRDAVILRAGARLLAETDLNLDRIAELTGFCDAFHFSKRFRQVIGVSPREYRQRARAR